MAISTGMALLGGLSAAGSLAGGLMGKGGSDAAAGMTQAAGQQAQRAASHQGDVNRADAAPWTATGSRAIQQIGALLGYGGLSGTGAEGSTLGYGNDYSPGMQQGAIDQLRSYAGASGATMPTYTPVNYLTNVSDTFTADPSYDWRVSEGNKALDRTAASKGMLLSGSQIKGATDYNSNVASQEYGNWYGRYQQQAQFNKGANQQNFGQQQQLYQDQYGQWRDALGDVFKTAGLGAQTEGQTAGVNSGLTASGNNALTGSATAAGNFTQSGANTLASGIGSGVNNLVTAGAVGLGNGSNVNGLTADSRAQPQNYASWV